MALDVEAAGTRASPRSPASSASAPSQLAEGICDVINAKMAQAIRTLTVEQGIEPRDFALVAFGGAGPMHAAFLAPRARDRARSSSRASPARSRPGACCRREIRQRLQPRRTYAARDDVDRGRAGRAPAPSSSGDGVAALAEEGVAGDTRRGVEHALDIRYVGQEYTLTIPLARADEPRGTGFRDAPRARFDEAHEPRYGHANPGAPVEFVVVRATGARRPRPRRAGAAPPARGTARAAVRARPSSSAAQRSARRSSRRDDLAAGDAVVAGPAIVEERPRRPSSRPGARSRWTPSARSLIAIGEDA